MNSRFFRRRHYVVNKPFQIKYAAWNVIWLTMFGLFLGIMIFWPIKQEIDNAVTPAREIELYKVALDFHQYLWPPLLIMLLGIFLMTIFMTHRVAGPLYRLRVTLERMVKGDFSLRIRFRKWDEFMELADLCNQVCERVEAERAGRGAVAPVALEGVVSEVEALHSLAEKDADLPVEVRKKIQAVHEALNRVV